MPPSKILALLLGSCALSAADFTVTRLQTGDITRSIQLLGEVRPQQQVALHAKVSGYVRNLRVDLGDRVTEGALLAELDVPELVADAARSLAELKLAELEYQRIQAAQKQAPDLVMQQTVDAAEARLAIAKAQQERNGTLLNFARITAPFAGTITQRTIDKGAFVPAATASNSATAAALFVLTDSTVVRIHAAVPENDCTLVTVGQTIAVTTEPAGSKALLTKVSRVAGVLDPSSKTMLIEALLDNANGALKPGMFASVKLGIETHQATNLLPLTAIVMEKTVATAYINEGGKARRRVLKAGFNDGQKLEVLGGLNPTDEVIVVGAATLTDGQAVTLQR